MPGGLPTDLLFAHDRGDPFLSDGADPESAADDADKVEEQERTHLGANPDKWAVLVPDTDDGERWLAAVWPLIEKRAEDQGESDPRALVVKVPPAMDGDRAADWKDRETRLYSGNDLQDPLYLCILGDMDGISLETQRQLALDRLPGRLAFDDAPGFEAYADKVVGSEKNRSSYEKPNMMFYTVHDGTVATRTAYDQLITPCYQKCHDEAKKYFKLPAADVIDAGDREEPYPQEFLDLTASRHPTVLFSLSHGVGPPRRGEYTPRQARERQGAMHFGGSEDPVLPGDVANQPFLPGGLWFSMACFGAGTPTESAYAHWLEHLRSDDMEGMGALQSVLKGLSRSGGFTAGLVKAALANPDGPLAVIGHIDLAWSYSYRELRVSDGGVIRDSNRSDNFFAILDKLIGGARAGQALERLQTYLTSVSHKLNRHYDESKRSGGSAEGDTAGQRLDLGNLWMLYQDLAGYVLVGDPAVRLPLARPAEQAATGDRRRRRSMFRAALGGGASRARKRAGGASVTDVEEVILRLGARRIDEDEAADELGASTEDVGRWSDVYREAGRKALRAELGESGDEDD